MCIVLDSQVPKHYRTSTRRNNKANPFLKKTNEKGKSIYLLLLKKNPLLGSVFFLPKPQLHARGYRQRRPLAVPLTFSQISATATASSNPATTAFPGNEAEPPESPATHPPKPY
jgi:hypothetical protein